MLFRSQAASIAAAAPAEDQAALFPLPCADKSGRIAAARANGLKGGRPPGAQNLSTRAWREYLLARGVMPQQKMMEMLLMGVEGLAKWLDCPRGVAFDRYRQLLADAAPYFMPRMAPVDDAGKPMPHIGVYIGGREGVTIDGKEQPPWLYREVEQDQRVSEAGASRSKEQGDE